MICEMCGGQGEFLGQLGPLFHYRCQSCGMMMATEEPPRHGENYGEEDYYID